MDDATDALYLDPRLAAIYDLLHGVGDDVPFYLSLADGAPKSILDGGCGTGALAIALSRRGHRVTAIDPSLHMISLGTQKPGAADIDWRVSTLHEFDTTQTFDLIIMTGHAFQCLLADEDIAAAFRAVRKMLGPGARFVFETRNPAVEPWRRWTPEQSRMTARAQGGAMVSAFHETLSVMDEIVTLKTVYNIDGNSPLISKSALRFASLDRIRAIAEKEGLNMLRIQGDWDGSSFSHDSPEIIVTAGLQA